MTPGTGPHEANHAGSMVDKPQVPIITKGRVVFAFPELNVYAVQPREMYTFTGKGGYEMAIDISEHACTSKVGVSGGSSYAPGAEVMLLRLTATGPVAKHDDSYDLGIYSFILGPSYQQPLVSSKVFANLRLDPPFLDFLNSEVRNATKSSLTISEYIQDRSFGRPMDMVAGDFIKSNMFGGQIRLTMMRAAVGASPLAQVQFSALDNSMDVIYERKSVQSDAVHHTEYPAWDDFNRVYRYARTMSEGLGAYSDALKENSNDDEFFYEPHHDDQQGIFRQVSFNGPLVEGSYELMLTPEKQYEGGAARRISVHNDPQFGLSAIQRTYDGSVSVQGVKNVGLQRSAYVWAPRELELEDNNPELNTLELDPPATDWSSLVNIPEEQQPDYASLMRDKRQEHSLNRYFTQITQKEENSAKLWKTYSKEDVEKKYGDIVDIETKLEPLPDNKDGYDTPATVEITDPLVPDEVIKLKALLAAIELDETGAVYLHDGWGSEISMSRGNISLRPAADLRLEPGRSLIGLVPRDTAIRSRHYVELTSDLGDVLIKSQRDMKMLSGNGRQGGQLTLENRSEARYNADHREGFIRSGGIVIKSYNADLSITAPDIYMGLLATGDDSRRGRRTSAKGLLNIDASQGLLATQGDSMLNQFRSGIANIVGDNTLLGLDTSGLIIAGSGLGIACPTIQCGPVTDNPVYPVITESGIEQKTMAINTPRVTLKVAGSVQASTGTFVSSCVSDFMAANTVTGANGSFGNASDHSGLIGGSGPGGGLRIGEITVNTRALVGVMRGMTSAVKGAVLEQSGFTGYGILYSGFFFQQENKYDVKGRVEARYQRMLRKNGDTRDWGDGGNESDSLVVKPEAVPSGNGDVTDAWPGREAEQSTFIIKTVSDDGLSSEDLGGLRNSYVINSQK